MAKETAYTKDISQVRPGAASTLHAGIFHEFHLLELHRANDMESLWRSIVELMYASLSCQHLVATLPYQGVAPMAVKTTMPHEEPQAFWQKLNAADPPLFKIIRSSPGIPLVVLDDHLSEEELHGSRFYREIMLPGGWRHLAGLVFWDGREVAAHIGVWRTAKQGRFTDQERNLLMAIRPHIEAAIKRVGIITRLELVTSLMADALEHPTGDGIVLLDARGKPVFRNHAAIVACTVWQKGRSAAAEQVKSGTGIGLPACVHQAAMELISRFLEELRTSPMKGTKFETEIPHPTGEPVSARARVIAPKAKPVPPHVRIEFSRIRQNQNGHASFVPIYRLSKSEHRVAILVASGMRNSEVAREMGLSVNTVRAHLREVFSKLGISHRGQIMDRLSPAQHGQDGFFEI